MAEIDLVSLISGIVFLIGGLFLLGISFLVWQTIFWALICLGIGIAILSSLEKQNKIEQINAIKNKDIKIRKK